MTADTSIRVMRPSDVNRVVAIHLATFRGFFLSSLGPRFLGVYYRCAATDPSVVALVAERDEPVGFAVGSIEPRGFYRRILRRHWPSFLAASIPAVLRHPGSAVRVMGALRHPATQPADDGVAVLFSLGVAPESQSKGIGRRLVEDMAHETRARGARALRLETDAHANERVLAFYEGLGFQEIGRYTRPEGRAMVEYELDLTREGPSS